MADEKVEFPLVQCLYCDANLVFPEYITKAKQYKGQVKCSNCRAILRIKTVNNDIYEYEQVSKGGRQPITILEYPKSDSG